MLEVGISTTLFSGGLCCNLWSCKALSPKTNIRPIIPKASSSTDIGNVNVIGLNQLSLKEIDLERIQFNLSSLNTEVHQLPLTISPYHYTNQWIETRERNSSDTFDALATHQKSIDQIHSIFSGNEAYGPDIMYKVYLFSKLSEEIAADGKFDVIHAHDWVTYPPEQTSKNRRGKPLGAAYART
ncbi:MAG: hypothetical protein IPJ20_02745 [Flammeovirgaceae bacterium]|nr:hypothetical protein [Flammeovirgaceae bacterium]